jgi:hypothetical protein
MNQIFDFTKTYTGAIIENESSFPCNLSFPEGKIIFQLLSSGEIDVGAYYQTKDLYGFIATEGGIMKFRAHKAFQISHLRGGSRHSKLAFLANSILVTLEKNDIRQDLFSQCNVVFDNLQVMGRYVDIDHDFELGTFSIKRTFEKLDFKNDENSCTFENGYRWNLKPFDKTFLALHYELYFSFMNNASKSIEQFIMDSVDIARYLQLIFDVRPLTSELILLGEPLSEGSVEECGSQYYYYNREMINSKVSKTSSETIKPEIMIEDIQDELTFCFHEWASFNEKRSLIKRLYFNEINSKEYITDDRFKNFCSIIQGLEAFTGKVRVEETRGGGMEARLRVAIGADLEELLIKRIDKEFLYKLLKLIGHQRDHYQHLSKTLGYDLGRQADDMIAVNGLLAAIIRYHLLSAIKFPKDKIDQLVDRDLYWIERELRILQQKISIR